MSVDLNYRDEVHRGVQNRTDGRIVPICWLVHAAEQDFVEEAYLEFAWDAWPEVAVTNDNTAVLCSACLELIHA
jgi:hypothetical protein